MSLSTETPEPRRAKAAPGPQARPAPSHRAGAERLFRRFEHILADGEHHFPKLRQDFAEWCEVGDVAPVSDVTLAAWLRQAGLTSYRAGRAKVTCYAKRAARSAA